MSIQTYLKTANEGKEKHLPDIQVKESEVTDALSIKIIVGKDALHPSTPEHAIKTITLYGITNENQLKQIAVFHLTEDITIPVVRVSIKKDRFKELIATSYCNLHGLWESNLVL